MARIAVIDRDKCKPKDCGYLCIKICPLIRNKIEVITLGNDQKPIIHEDLCIGCGICVKKCPFNAIYIINLPDEYDKSKIFQYGPNTFRLYGLPIPRKGSVVGIIGPNGIGKSTSIKILAGILKPNFGEYDKKFSEKEIIEKFRGSELQSYFDALYSKKLKISFKPQDLLVFRRLYGERKVEELLKKVDEKGRFDEIVEKFNLKNILDRKVKDLSGGELQKALIAAALLKDYNVLFLDEPTAFLDIKERLRVANIIEKEISDEKMIILIEHDLTILDYLTEFVHIVYGRPKVYGIFSMRKSSRQGINEFLEGFLRNENVRIRDKKIVFEVKAPEREKYKEKVIEWGELHKEYEGFKLRVHPGYIGKTEIVGVVGPNGIGKSTFMKILAGEIKPDAGSIGNNVKISYKPQYIEPIKDITVQEFLRKANPEYRKSEYVLNIIRPLGVDLLFEKDMNKLSGGELQATYIVATLLKEADLYVLDEPSAFLDVEQRINLAKILRDFIKSKEKACIVVDHDILFIDYISDSLMVFLGEPGRFGEAWGPLSMREGMNRFLRDLGITFRRDPDTKRPRINKPGSYLDRIQKEKGEYYYI